MKKIILLLIMAVSLSACSVVLKTPTELIKKPALPSSDIAQNSILESLPAGAKLIRPYNSGELSSLDYFAWDEDDEQEIYAFFKNSEKSSVGVLVSDKNSGSWQTQAIIEEVAGDIAFVSFVDFDQDGIKDILLGLSVNDDTLSVLNCYHWQNNQYVNIFSEKYANILIDDISGDGKDDIFLFNLDLANYIQVKVLQYQTDTLVVANELTLGDYDTGYYSVQPAFYQKDKKAICIDRVIGSQYSSNLLLFDGQKISTYFDTNSNLASYEQTYKRIPIKSSDINGDGLINIASTLVPDNYQKNYNNDDYVPYLSAWHMLDDDKMEVISLSYDNMVDSYRIILPHKWFKAYQEGKLKFLKSRPNAKKNYISFYYTTAENSYRLYTIENIASDNYDQLKEQIETWGGKYYLHGFNSKSNFVGYSFSENGNLSFEDRLEFNRLLLNENELGKLVEILE